MKRLILNLIMLAGGLFLSTAAFAQPANDNCTAAQTITPNGTCVNGTTVGANDSWTNTVGCQSGGSANSHEDVWYTFVATGTNFTSTVTAGGAWTGNVEFVLASGTCATSFTLVTSSCGASPLTVNATGLTIGQTYYFTVSNSGTGTNGTFQVCTTTSNPPMNCTDNDDCASPTFLSTTANVQTCVTDCNTGAAPGPEFTGNNCYDFPQETVWYQVSTGASAATMDIAVTSVDLTTPYFTVFTTANCSNFTIVNCTQGAAGSASNTVNISANTTYLIAISDGLGQAGNFNLCVTVNDDNSACNTNDNLAVTATSMGSPLTGPFQPGEIVTFCYTITDWQPGASCNYLQGIVPTFGDCWDPVSFTAQGQPVTITTPLVTAGVIGNCPPGPPCPYNACSGTSAGTWSWFPAGAVTYNNISGTLPMGSPMPAGWYFLTSYNPATGSCTGDPTDPDNSYGDNSYPACNATLDWQVCFQLKAQSSIACTNGQTDCSVQMKTYADGEIGVWNNVGCVADIPASFTTNLSCCIPPTANAGADKAICSGGSTTIGAASVAGMTYSWSPATGLSSATSANPTVTLTNNTASPVTTTFVVTQTETATGCSDTDTVLVTVNPLPAITISGTRNICAGASTVLTASGGSTYTWTPNTNLSATTGSSVTANPGATITYTVTGTSAAGCLGTDTMPVRVINIGASITSSTNVLCNGGSTGSATVAGSGGTGAYTYSWNTSPVQNTPTATSLAAGNYSVTVSNSGCSATASVTITQPSALTASATSVNPTCNLGTNGTATANPLGGTGAYTYSWNTTPAQTTQTATGLAAGNYTVTVRDANNCSTTANVTLTTPSAVTVATSTTNTNCGSSTGTATATPAGGTGAYTYSWATTPAQTTQTATGLAAGAYNVTVTDANGCTGSGTATVNNNGAPTVTITSVTNVLCNGASTGSITASASGGSGGYTYTWNTTPVQNTATATGLPAGNYAVTVNDAGGCTGNASATVTQPAVISITTTPTSPLCNGGNGSALASVTGGTGAYTYSWNTSPAQTTATASNIPAGTYQVTVTDANGCSKNASVTITQPAALNLSTSTTGVTCNGGVNGTATATASGGTGTLTYSWSTTPVQTSAVASGLSAGLYNVTVTDANGCSINGSATVSQPNAITTSTSFNAPSCNGGTNGTATVTANGGTGALTYSWNTTPAQTTATATGLSAGNYSVLVTDANGCTTNAAVTVTEPNILAVNVTGSNPSCNGAATGSATANVSGGTGAYTYSWNTTPAQTTATASGLAAGAYAVTVTDANGCSLTENVTLTQPTAITGTILQTNVSCNGLANGSATVNASGGTGTLTYSWSTTPVQTTSTASGLSAGNYSVTVTDANGCQFNDNVTITEPVELTSSITSSTDVSCNGGSDGSATVTAAGGTTSYSYLWTTSPAQTSATATGLAAGSYDVFITDANGCTSTSTAVISQPGVLSVATTSTNSDCTAPTGTATATPSGGTGSYTYSWDISPVQTTQTATGLASGTYDVTVTDANGCTQTAQAIINNNGAPNLSVTATTDATCFGSSDGSITVTATGGTGSYTFSWNSAPSQNTATASNLPAGNYAVTVTDAAGCSATINGTVNEPAELIATVTGTDALCYQGTGSATVSVAGGTGTYTYSWDTNPVETTATVSGLSAGNYNVTVTDANGCTDAGAITISEPAAILVTATGTPALCSGSSDGSATATVTNGVGTLVYSWSTTPSQSTPSITSLAAGTYTLTVTDDNNCFGTDTAVVTEPAALVADITSFVDVACNGGTTGSADATATGGTGTYTYSWDTNPVQTTATATGLAAGTYNVQITDANGCTSTDAVTIAEPGVISIAETITNASCAGNDGSLVLNASGGVGPYQFSIDNGSTFQASGTFNNVSGGNYQVVVTDNNGCSSTASYVIGSGGVLNSSISAKSNVTCATACDGSATVTASGGSGNYSYSWSTTPVTSTPTASGLCAGTYTVSVSENSGSCVDTSIVVITEPLALSGTVTNTNVLCFGGTTGTASVNNVTGGTGAYSYSWNTSPVQTTATATGLNAGNYTVTVTDENNCSITLPVSISPPAAALTTTAIGQATTCASATDGQATASASGGVSPYTFTWTNGQAGTPVTALAAGTYTLVTADANGCTATDTAVVTSPGQITATSGSTEAGCNQNNGSAFVTAAGGTGTLTYSWTGVSGANSASLNNIGGGNYSVVITDANNCSITVNVPVTEESGPMASFTATPMEGLAPLAVLFNNTSTNAIAYSWNFGNGDSSIAVNPSTVYDEEGSFIVVLTATSGSCVDTMSVTIKVIGKSIFEVPNVFTPDGDGRNDNFSMIAKNISSMRMQIFNRWGEKVFDNEDGLVEWDGRQGSGQACNAGTYYYIITAKGVDNVEYGPITGFVTLIR